MARTDAYRQRIPVGDLRPDEHTCLVFASDEEQADIMRAFVRDGLRAGQRVVYFADAGYRSSGAAAVRRYGAEADAKAGQIQLMSAHQDTSHMVRRLEDELRRARADGCPVLRVSVEMSGLLRRDRTPDRLLDYERRAADVLAGSMALSICQYDTRRFRPIPGRHLEALAAAAHPRSVEADPLAHAGELRISRTYQPHGLRVSGVVDELGHRALAGALERVMGGSGDIHLDLAGLEFVDVEALRMLVSKAKALPAGRQLVLVGLAPHLRQVMSLVGWDETPGLRMDEPSAV